jgi:ferredoxin
MRYNYYLEQNREKDAMLKYAALPTAVSETCLQCDGLCENACPYGVTIQGLLMMAHHNLSFG